MFIKVVRPGKPLATDLTAVRFDARVRPPVPGQLVRPRELPATARPVAGEGLLARVSPHVGLQVGGLGVELPAAGVLTLEYFVLVLYVSFGRGISPRNPRAVGKIVFVVDVQFTFVSVGPRMELITFCKAKFLLMIFNGNCGVVGVVGVDPLSVVVTSHVTVCHQTGVS